MQPASFPAIRCVALLFHLLVQIQIQEPIPLTLDVGELLELLLFLLLDIAIRGRVLPGQHLVMWKYPDIGNKVLNCPGVEIGRRLQHRSYRPLNIEQHTS